MAINMNSKNLSKTGLEPVQITPHAPQTCASTIPPLRQIIFKFQRSIVAEATASPTHNKIYASYFLNINEAL